MKIGAAMKSPPSFGKGKGINEIPPPDLPSEGGGDVK